MKGRFDSYITRFSDFPKQGVSYFDFTPLLEDPSTFRAAISTLKRRCEEQKATRLAAIEAKGFLIASALAYELKLPLSLIRKKGLTPGPTLSRPFVKEYGEAEYEIKEGIFKEEDRVVIVYDILAAPGASHAALSLVSASGAKVVGFCFVIELEYLRGRDGLKGYDVFSLVQIPRREGK